MAENFQAEVYGGNWPWQWNDPSSRPIFGSSPCFSSSGINDFGALGSLSEELFDSKDKSSDESAGSASDGSIVIQDLHITPSRHEPSNDSSLQIMDIDLSSSLASDWNQALIHGNGISSSSMQQEDRNHIMDYRHETESVKNFVTLMGNSSINSFESVSQDHLSLHQKQLNSTNFPISSASHDYSSRLLQALFETDQPQTQQSFYPLTSTFPTTLNEFQFDSVTKFASSSNSCSQSAVALNDFTLTPFPSAPKFLPSGSNHGKKPNHPDFKPVINNEEDQDLGPVAKQNGCESPFKRPRIETPSPLPTFKVRKEKLGDRVTALQQLVSPFGKTDTASVLHEAIEYIKHLHDQVNVLSTPYLKNGAPIQHLQTYDKAKEQGPKLGLKRRGLCLVPISSTFPVAAGTTADFWTPTLGRTFS